MDYTILNLNPQTIALYKSCFDNNGSPKKTENIEWQFFKNTEASAFVDIAFDEQANKAAAIYAVSSVKFKIGNELLLGTQSLDTITDIDYRGKGLFITLAKEVYAKSAAAGAALVYGFPNGNSIHGFVKKLDWQVLDPLPFLIKPLQSKYFTDKIKPLRFLPNISLSFGSYAANKNYKITESSEFPEAATALWNAFSQDIKVAVHRDKAYLDWRYIQKPNEDYKIAHCYDSQNQYLGYIVFAVKDKHNGKIAYIMELIYDKSHPKAGSQLLKYAISQIKKQKADCILSWCLEHSPNFKTYKSSFFINMPEKFRPIELHFGATALREDLKTLIYNRENWFISYSDSDTV